MGKLYIHSSVRRGTSSKNECLWTFLGSSCVLWSPHTHNSYFGMVEELLLMIFSFLPFSWSSSADSLRSFLGCFCYQYFGVCIYSWQRVCGYSTSYPHCRQGWLTFIHILVVHLSWYAYIIGSVSLSQSEVYIIYTYTALVKVQCMGEHVKHALLAYNFYNWIPWMVQYSKLFVGKKQQQLHTEWMSKTCHMHSKGS